MCEHGGVLHIPETRQQIGILIRLYESRRVVRQINRLSKPMIAATRQFFRDQRQRVESKAQLAWRRVFHEAQSLREASDADLFAMMIFETEDEEALLFELMNPFYADAGTAGADNSTDVLSNFLRRRIQYRSARAWIENNAIRFGRRYASSVTATMNDMIRNQISLAIGKGEGLQALMDRIEAVYQQATTYRAEMIGRTEIGRAYCMSKLNQDRAYGLTSFDEIGCNPDCPQCGPFMDENPHSDEDIESFLIDVHPNHVGNQAPNIPPDFVPSDFDYVEERKEAHNAL